MRKLAVTHWCSTPRVTSEHPKVTAYVPKKILSALDSWKSENHIESRSAAIVAILADYLGVAYLVRQESNALSTVLTELAKLSERLTALEQQAASSALQEVLSTAPAPEPSSTTLIEAPSSAPLEKTTTASAVQGKAPSTAPTSAALQPKAPLSQMALAKRLGVSDKAVEKRRKQGKENFARWSRERDPDSIAWTWEGRGGRGQPLRFVPLTSSD